MKKVLILLLKLPKALKYVVKPFNTLITSIIFYKYNIQHRGFQTNGIPYIHIDRNAKCIIGQFFKMNNTVSSNPIGRVQQCIIVVRNEGILKIGNNVGISSTTFYCTKEIVIGDNVLLGGGVCIYDTDFHPLDPLSRLNSLHNNTNYKSVVIEENVFIGAHTTILKGVWIGKNSVVGACSVVTRNIPQNEIWAGNPAKFIRCLAD